MGMAVTFWCCLLATAPIFGTAAVSNYVCGSKECFRDTVESTVSETRFEGPEKRLSIVFRSSSTKVSLRSIQDAEWSQILAHAQCSILNKTSNEQFDSYLLSESTLLVYPARILLKTCGTTTLLESIRYIFESARGLHFFPTWVGYSRSAFMFPRDQPHPHTSFEDEVSFLSSLFGVTGSISIFRESGDRKNDRVIGDQLWHMYEVSLNSPPNKEKGNDNDLVPSKDEGKLVWMEMFMFDLNHNVSRKFYSEFWSRQCLNSLCSSIDDGKQLARHVAIESGIARLLPLSSIMDVYLFDPCGFSLNALFKENYWTIHITPQSTSSFASFETNYVTSTNEARTLVNEVVQVLQPGRFRVVLHGISDDLLGEQDDDVGMWNVLGYEKPRRLEVDGDKRDGVTVSMWKLEIN